MPLTAAILLALLKLIRAWKVALTTLWGFEDPFDFDKNEEESPKLFSEDTDINNNEHSHDESKIEPEIEKDLSNVSFDDKDDLEIPAFLRRQTN